MKYLSILILSLFYFHEVRAQKENTAVDFYNKAVEYFNAKNYELAIASYTSCINSDNTNSKAFLFRGISYLQLKQVDNAIKDFDESIKLDPSNAKTLLNKGYALLLKGDFKGSIASLSESVLLDPNNAKTYLHRGTSYMKSGDCGMAIKDLTIAISLGEHTYSTFLNRAICKSKTEDIKGALADFNAASDLKPDQSVTSLEKSKIYLKLYQWNDAIVELSHAIRKNAGDSELYYYRGYAKLMIEDDNGALMDFNICLQINPTHDGSLKNKAMTTFKMGKFEEASLAYTDLLKRDSKNPELYVLRGTCHLESKNFHNALADYTEAISFKKNFAEAYFNRANTYTKLLDYKKACEDIKKASELGYEPANAHINNLCN